MIRRYSALLVSLILLVGLHPSSAAEDPVEAYIILPLTGTAAFVGRAQAQTTEAVEKYVNSHGGIRGRPIHFNIMDDATSPATAVQIANQLIAKGVQFWVGPSIGAMCQAVGPLVEANGPTMYCLTPIGRPQPGGYIFLYNLHVRDFQANVFRYLKAKGVRKLGLLPTTDATGADAERAAEDAVKYPDLRDMRIVDVEHFTAADISVAAQVSRIRAAGAEAIVSYISGTAVGTALRGIYESGFTGYVFISSSNAEKEQIHQYQSFLPEKLIFNTLGYQMSEGVPARVEAAKKTFLEAERAIGITDPTNGNMVAWDPLMLVVDGLRKYGPQVTARQMRDHLFGQRGWPGIMGMYDFSRGDQRGLDPKSSGVMRYDRASDSFVVISKVGGAPL
jgi:branched-chain amino acid transport system substrate-binding protein